MYEMCVYASTHTIDMLYTLCTLGGRGKLGSFYPSQSLLPKVNMVILAVQPKALACGC